MSSSPDAVLAASQKLLKSRLHALKFALEVLEAPSDDPEPPVETNRVQPHVSSRRYLFICSTTVKGFEEAALVVFRRPSAPLITQCLPIYADFSLSISQKKANHSPTSERERSRFRITFTSTPTTFTLVTESIDPFTPLIAEVKRLQAIAVERRWKNGGASHDWLYGYRPYDGALDKDSAKRFDSISSAYSMRMAHTAIALRTGISSINWEGPKPASPGSVVRNEIVAHGERDKWIVQQLQDREAEFTQKEDIPVWTGSFNVNDKLPDTSDLSDWLSSSNGAALLVFGFQEFDLSTEALVRYTPYREEIWRTAIEKALGERAQLYEKLHSKQLVGALLLVYVLKSEAFNIGSVHSSSLATGILGLVANKGATAVRLRYKDSYLTFVNSHLAAFTNQVDKRNHEMKDIGTGLSFPYDAIPGEAAKKERDPWTPNCKPEVERPLNALGIYDSHQIIWVGDLNYRLELPRVDVERMIEAKEWELLLRFDQLRIQKQHGLAWSDFEEARIAFPPTYKFDVGTTTYDTSEKQRTPSWTDRIQWLTLHEGTIECLSYRSHPEITISDHQPISALLKVQVLSIITSKRQQVQEEIMAELDTFDNDQLPDVKILPGPAVQFDTIDYLKPESREIEVKNIGRVIAQWTFVLRPEATQLCEPWLHIHPTSGLILPGESSFVTLTIHVDSSTAPALNFSTDPNILSDLLIISIEKKDLFLAVQTRTYNPTCFSNSLSQLARLGKPIRKAKPQELDAVREGTDEFDPETAKIPNEISRMINFLAEHALDLGDVFLSPGSERLVALIRDCLDTGDPFPAELLLPNGSQASSTADCASDSGIASSPSRSSFEDISLEADIGAVQLSPTRARAPPRRPVAPPAISISDIEIGDEGRENLGVHSMADCLIRFLDSLSEPVVSFEAYPKALRTEQRADAFRVVESLPTLSQSTLLYIVAFLKVLVARTHNLVERLARIDRLAVVFSSVLLRADPTATPDSLPPASLPRRRKAFMLHLLSDLNETVTEQVQTSSAPAGSPPPPHTHIPVPEPAAVV